MLPRRFAPLTLVVALGVLALAVAALTSTGPTSAATAAAGGAVTPTSPPLSPGRPDTECISANPRPDCYRSGEFPRSSRGHLILFGVLAAGLGAIGIVVVRSVRRTDRAHRAREASSTQP